MKNQINKILENLNRSVTELANMNPMIDQIIDQYQEDPLFRELKSIKKEMDKNIKKGNDLTKSMDTIQDFIKIIEKNADRK